MNGFYITELDNLVYFAREDGSDNKWCLHLEEGEVSIKPAWVVALTTDLKECPYFKDNEHPKQTELDMLQMINHTHYQQCVMMLKHLKESQQ